mgnify:CR=1 FL=1
MSEPNPNKLDDSRKNRGQKSGEFELIARYFAPLAGPGALGLGDDAAILTPRVGYEMVLTSDAIVSGIHFLPDDPPEDVAWKLLGVNLSDLAAMGAEPLGYLITTAWPRDLPESWVMSFASGLGAAQECFKISLLGGDTVVTPGPLTLSLTGLGYVPQNGALRRNGAQVGDLIFVSGQIGDAGVGLKILLDGHPVGDNDEQRSAVERYRRPRPQLALGMALRDLASACIDVSDGLVADLEHLANQSSLKMNVRLDLIPITPLAEMLGGAAGAVVAGDDYELLFTASPESEDRIFQLARDLSVPISTIGHVTDGSGVEITDPAGKAIPLDSPGYRHF